MKDRFAIIQSKEVDAPVGKLMPPLDSKCAAFYYPWIKVIDPLTQSKKLVPPCGHIAGVYARSDTERGVHKAPANEVLRGALELQFPISRAKQDILNPRGVNCIRVFPGRGIRIWGARTVSSDPIWKYVNIRRLFLYVGESIEEGTQWVVFEPSNERLWARVNQTVTQFLLGVWKSGALIGSSPAEAFFVRCDRTTMTQDDIDNGRLVCVIGIAATKPAEFVILRIAQWQGGSAATE
jgi:phage tail sheath protein FI